MFTQRHTAYKLKIKDLLNNEYVQVPGESDYVKINELQVSRARVMVTVVNKFINDDKKSGFLVIDDGSESMRARGWEDQYELIDNVKIGDLVDIIGRVRKYNEEVYLVPEIIKPISPNWFVVRKLELSNKKPVQKNDDKEEADSVDKDKIYELIKKLDEGEGAELKAIIKESGLKRSDCLSLVRELMGDGVVFEPKSEKYKALD